MWVVTPQKAYAETTMYELEVTVLPRYTVVVDIIDYNPLTNIERVSKLSLLVLLNFRFSDQCFSSNWPHVGLGQSPFIPLLPHFLSSRGDYLTSSVLLCIIIVHIICTPI